MADSAGSVRSSIAHAGHLVGRFFGAVRPGAPAPADQSWALQQLLPGEQVLWHRMNNPDRRHAVGVARAVVAEIGPNTAREVIAAALLHDVGKVTSALRTPGRVVATLVWTVTPDQRADQWLERGRPLRRLAEYRRHPEIGEELLEAAGADQLTSNWAGDHHKPEDQWRVDGEIGAVLKSCDDD